MTNYGTNLTIPRRAAGPRPEFLDDPHLDNMLSMIMTVAQELWVMDERVLNLELQLAELKGVDLNELRDNKSTAEIRAARRADLDEFVRRILRSSTHSMREPSDTDAYQALVTKASEPS